MRTGERISRRADGPRRRQPHRRRRPGHARRALLGQQLPHPPLTLLFTVREESGLFGAATSTRRTCGGAVMGFNFDGRSASDITIGAVGAERWEVESHRQGGPRRRPPRARRLGHHGRGAGPGRGARGRLVRQGDQGRPRRARPTSAASATGRPVGRRGHQRRNRLRPRQGRVAQPRPGLRAEIIDGLRGGVRGRGESGDGQRRQAGEGEFTARPTTTRSGWRTTPRSSAGPRRRSNGPRPGRPARSPTAAWTPTGSSATASRRSRSGPARTPSTPSRSTSK